jgi:hypothetical protein
MQDELRSVVEEPLRAPASLRMGPVSSVAPRPSLDALYDDDTNTDRRPPVSGADRMVDEASAEHPNRTLRPPSPEGAHGAAAASGRPKVRPDDEDETETETETGTMLSADVRARIEQMMQSLPDPSPPAVLGPTKPPR